MDEASAQKYKCLCVLPVLHALNPVGNSRAQKEKSQKLKHERLSYPRSKLLFLKREVTGISSSCNLCTHSPPAVFVLTVTLQSFEFEHPLA